MVFSITCMLLLVSCTPSVDSKSFCKEDSDCVPADCCHSTTAVNKEYSPHCEGVACTLECAPNTLDCGQGELKCISNECAVVIS